MEKHPKGDKIRQTQYQYLFSVLFIVIYVLFFSNTKYVTCSDSGVSEIGDEKEREVCFKSDCDHNTSKRPIDSILPHLLNIYGPNATPKDFEIYAPNATFEDPLMCAHGIQQIKSAFYSIPKVFSESRITDYSVQEDVISPTKQEILIDNKQHYKFLGKDITMISLIKLEVVDGKVVRHEDRWDKKPLMNRETVKFPFIGRILETTRRGSMLATHAMMRFGKDPAA